MFLYKKGGFMSTTLENLTKAFIGESQARNRYTFYAKVAREEGFEQIAFIFEETANQEKEHAKNLFKLINSLIFILLSSIVYNYYTFSKSIINVLLRISFSFKR